jgi:hypothetical protein
MMASSWVHNVIDRAEAKGHNLYDRAGAKVHDLSNSVSAKAHNLYERTFHPAHMIAGICKSPTVDQVNDLLKHAASLTKKAKGASAFANSIGALDRAGQQLNRAVEAIDDATKKGAKLSADVSAACEISDAIEVLNTWTPSGGGASSEEAAKAFDKLFGGVGHFMARLPTPLDQFADIFAAIAKYNFVANIQSQQDPGGAGSTSGRLMREIDKIPELGRH